MGWLRKSSAEPTRRQRLQRAEPTQLPSSFAYRSRRSQEALNVGRQADRPPPQETNRLSLLHRGLSRLGYVVLALAITVSAVNVLLLSTNPRVVPLNNATTAAFLRSPATYQAASARLLAASIMNRNKVTINTSQVSAQLLQQFPELAGATITLPLLAHRPIIYIQPSQIVLVLATGNGSYVVTKNGKAVLSSSQLSPDQLHGLPLVTDQNPATIHLGSQALTSADISFIQTITTQLAAQHVPIDAMTLPAGSRELDVHIAGQPYFVKFNLEQTDARQQAGTFLASWAYLQSQHSTPAHYIDVRIDGRAYYQ